MLFVEFQFTQMGFSYYTIKHKEIHLQDNIHLSFSLLLSWNTTQVIDLSKVRS